MSAWFFAWTGGEPIPAVNLETTGDIWSGSFETVAIVWGGELQTTGDVLAGGVTIGNLLATTALVTGQDYAISGTGIPADTTLTYDGAGGGTLSQASTVGTDISLTLSSVVGQSSVLLDDVGPLVIGSVYGIAATGIPAGATFIFQGGNSVDISELATETGEVSATLTDPLGFDTINNLGSVADLVDGFTYDVFGKGLPAGAQGTYGGGSTLTLLVKPTITGVAVPLTISKGKTYPDGGAFDPDVHLVEDEDIFAVEMTHAEGDFPALTLDVRNPKIGLLAAGRNLWGWLSWRNSDDVVIPLFHGRLVGVPESLTDEVVRLVFIARPNDYIQQKQVLAAALRELPYWDPIWLIDGLTDPDTVLETRTLHWHIDPTTLVVSTSDISEGEDALIDVAAGEHFYDGLSVAFGAAPLRRVLVTGTVSWAQVAEGDVDLTDALVAAFQLAGSPAEYPNVASYTGDGLVADWPAPGASIGGGWTVGAGTTAETIDGLTTDLAVTYVDRTDLTVTYDFGPRDVKPAGNFEQDVIKVIGANWKNTNVVFELTTLSVTLQVHYAASRNRTETASFVVSADVQSILTDPLTAEEETIALSSAFVDQGVDADGALPIGDPARNSYFPTDRGQDSLQYLMLLARAKLLSRARAVDIKFQTSLDKLAGVITCRNSVTLHDGRLPGGEARGKVKSYRFVAGESGEFAEVTIGCSVGYGVDLTATPGTNSYIDDYIDGYFEEIGGQVSVVEGKLVYDSLDGTYVVDDDGVDLLDMTAANVIDELIVTGGPNDQEGAINDSLSAGGNLASAGAVIGVGDGEISSITATTAASIGVYKLKILDPIKNSYAIYNKESAATSITEGSIANIYSLTNPNGVRVGTGILGVLFEGGGLSFTLAQGDTEFEPDDEIDITVSVALADRVGLTADPIGALGALPTRIELDLVPVTGGDFETDYVLRVEPLVVPQTINLEAPI